MHMRGLIRGELAVLLLAGCARATNLLDPSTPRFTGQYALPGQDTLEIRPIRLVTFNIKLARRIDRAIEVLRSDSLDGADVLTLAEMDDRGTDSIALFLVSFGFYLFLLASLTLIGGAPFLGVVRGPVALGHLSASLTMALLWLLAGRARLSLRSLGALDAVSFVVAGGFLSLMTIEDEGQLLQTLLALTVTVMVRAILMPSRPGRTLLLSALVFAPTVVVCIACHHPTVFLPGFSPGYQKLHMTLNTVLWSVLGTDGVHAARRPGGPAVGAGGAGGVAVNACEIWEACGARRAPGLGPVDQTRRR